MKCELKIVEDGTMLEITPESDVESIALRVWADKFFEIPTKANGAYLVILANTPNRACTGLATPSVQLSGSAQPANR